MSQTSTLGGQCTTEPPGTGLLIFFGVGCVVVLKVAGATFGQWEISTIWGLGVTMVIYLTADVFDAHLNPVVIVALWLFVYFDKHKVIPFVISQTADTFCAVALVYGLYYNLFLDFEQTNRIIHGSIGSLGLAGTFSTYPNPHINSVRAFAVEMAIIAILMELILALTDDDSGVPRGPLAPLLIGLLTAVIGASMGPLTGFAIDPTRDFGPKFFAWMAEWGEIAFTGSRDTLYFLVLVPGLITGTILGTWAYRKLIDRHLPYDICTIEEKDATINAQQKALQ